MANLINLYTANGFNPGVVPGLVTWWDFTDSNVMFTDAGTTLVTADAQSIQQVTDKVGGKTITQAVAGKRPTYKQSIVTGHSVARFAGASSQQLSTGAISDQAQPFTLFIVANQTSKATTARIIDGTGTGRAFLGFTVTNGFMDMYAGTGPLNDAVDHSGAFHVLSGVYNGASSKGYIDGALAVSGNAGTNSFGSGLFIGSDNTAAFFTGDIAHIFWYSGALSTVNHNTIGSNLARTFGKTWTTV